LLLNTDGRREKVDRLPELAAELARMKVDVLLSAGPAVTRALKEATLTMPVVMGFDNDPVGNGFVSSLARPPGNITGLSSLTSEISGKQLELLKEIIPKISRVAVLGSSTIPGNSQALRGTEIAAGAFGLQVQYLEVHGPKDTETAFRAATKERADAALVLMVPFLLSQRTPFADLAVKSRLPAIYWSSDFVEAGGLVTYSVSMTDLFRRAASYVDKILKGAKPADLPVEQPAKFELVINQRAAKQIGLTIPPSLLARADRIIK
jgi:putative ABC transport system substrate-binding protein